MIISDQDILTLYRRDDHEGMLAIYNKYYKCLCMFANRITGNMQMAEDIVQSLFAKCWQEHSFLTIKTSLKSFLFVSVRNASINELKKNAPMSLSEAPEPETTLFPLDDDDFPDPGFIQKLKKAINALPEQGRQVFLMVVADDNSYKETAATLGISVNTVKTHLSRALARLREILAPYHKE